MFSFMKKDKEHKKEKDERKKDKKEKKEKEKKEKQREPVTQEELKRLEEVKKGVFRRFSDREKQKKVVTKTTSDVTQVERDRSDSSISSSEKPSPVREVPADGAGDKGKQLPPPILPKPSFKGILKGSASAPNQSLPSNLDDSLVLQKNTQLNEQMSGVYDRMSQEAARSQTAPRSSGVQNGLVEATQEEPMSPVEEKSYKVSLKLPELVPSKAPRVRELVITRTPVGDFGFTLRKGVLTQRNDPDSKQSVIFAEPGVGQKGSVTGLIPGDRLVEVNGVNVEHSPREEIVELIKKAGETLTLKVQPIPELIELSVRPSADGGVVDVQDQMAKGGTLKRSGSMRYKKGVSLKTK